MPTQLNEGDTPVGFTREPGDTAEGYPPLEERQIESSRTEGRPGRKARAAKAKIAQLADKATARVDQASAAASELNSRAAAAYDRACASARSAQARIDPLVHERPYAAIGIAACAGVFLGMLLGRGPKVIHVRSRD